MSVALDVAIGLAFLYLSLALVVTTVQELIATIWRLRAGNLYDAIAGMLSGPAQPKGIWQKLLGLLPFRAKPAANETLLALFQHPLFRNLSQHGPQLAKGGPTWRNAGLPSYIPSKTFALALVDVLRGEERATSALGASQVLASASSIVASLPDGSSLKESLTLLVADVEILGGDLDERAKLVSARIEGWFNDRMARASGWYKQQAQLISLVIALFVSVGANADTTHVVARLWNDAALRAAVVADAQHFVTTHAPASAGAASSPPASGSLAPTPGASSSPPAGDAPPADPAKAVVASSNQLRTQVKELQGSALPVGWTWKADSALPCARVSAATADGGSSVVSSCAHLGAGGVALLLAGWLITALAVSLGANFWFDVLSHALQLRGSGPRISEASGRVED